MWILAAAAVWAITVLAALLLAAAGKEIPEHRRLAQPIGYQTQNQRHYHYDGYVE